MSSLDIRENVPLAPLATLRVGGPAAYLIRVTEPERELPRAYQFAIEKKLPLRVLGGGSNVLVPDEGFPGVVCVLENTEVETRQDGSRVLVTAGAGKNWDELVAETVDDGLWGLENLSGIPGSCGAAPVQNIGAYGAELSSTLSSLEVFDTNSQTIRAMTSEECRFGYRSSIFKYPEGQHQIITRITMSLTRSTGPNISYKDLAAHFADHNTEPTLSDIRTAVLEIRQQKFPDLTAVGTAGSFFKNPIVERERADELAVTYPELPIYELPDGRRKVSAAWILDHICGLRGYRSGHVGLFERQPLVLVNYGGASAAEIDAFASYVEDRVYEAIGVKLEREVRWFC